MFIRCFSLFVLAALALTAPAMAASAEKFLGVYSPVPGSCTPSESCCCAVTPVLVDRASAKQVSDSRSLAQAPDDAQFLAISGQSDGGDGCYGLTSMNGTFVVESETSAAFRLPQVDLSVTLELSPGGHLAIKSSRTECTVELEKQEKSNEVRENNNDNTNSAKQPPLANSAVFSFSDTNVLSLVALFSALSLSTI